MKTLLPHKTCLYSFSMVLGCIAYLFNRGVDASQVNLLKKALFLLSQLELSPSFQYILVPSLSDILT